MPSFLETSSRIQAAEGGGKSAGASCNTFLVEDSIGGIAEAVTWSMRIAQLQGAPTLDLSAIRAEGSPVEGGGTASGPCSFARMFDTAASVMLRPGKKNGVTVLLLDAKHPDILKWISREFKSKLERAYTAVLFRPGETYSPELLDAIAAAYDSFDVGFLCKTFIQDGEELYPNVCTEIRQKHKGQCILGAMNLAGMAKLSNIEFIAAMREGALAMADYLQVNQDNAVSQPELFAMEKQVGLGFVGMANFLGYSGVTYQEAVEWLTTELAAKGINLTLSDITPEELMEWLASHVSRDDRPGNFWLKFIGGVIAGSLAVGDRLDRIWTCQPTAHTSLRLGKKRENLSKPYLNNAEGKEAEVIKGYLNSRGLGSIRSLTESQADQVVIDLGLPTPIAHIKHAVAAELQPPFAVRLSGDSGSVATQMSQLKGSIRLTYPAYVQTRDEVDYETYYQFSCLIQEIFNFTGKAHTLSHSTWSDSIDGNFVKRWLDGPLGSLYYRLDPTPAAFLNKTETWDDEDLTDLWDLPEEPILCPIPKPGQKIDCEVCSM